MPSPWKVSPSPRRSDSISLVNCLSMKHGSKFCSQLVQHRRVLDDFRTVKGRTQHRGVRVLAAKAAADAAIDHRSHRVAAQRIGVVLDGERRAAREPDARVVAGAGVLVDAVLDANVTFSFRELLGDLGSQLALALELA